MMRPQKIVLTGLHSLSNEGAPVEVELGPFTQGIVVDKDQQWSGPCLIDVASRRTIVILGELGHMIVNQKGHLVSTGLRPVADTYEHAFIQSYPIALEIKPDDEGSYGWVIFDGVPIMHATITNCERYISEREAGAGHEVAMQIMQAAALVEKRYRLEGQRHGG